MTGTPVWFGPSDRPLFGMLHAPPGGRARAGVLLCSPLGLEEMYAYSTYRRLAEKLEANGFAALRFDYDGTGDSAGDSYDPGRVGAWLGSIEAAIELLRSCGVTYIAVVGMRMGATLAAVQLAENPVDALVLWDPCRSGRAYLREHRALQGLSLGGEAKTDGSLETPGFLYLAETVRELSLLDIAKTKGDMAGRVLLLTRPDRPRDTPLEERLKSALQIDRDEAIGQFELLNVPTREGQVPEEMLERIVAWLSETVDPVGNAMGAPPERKAVVGHNNQGHAIIERAIRIGPAELFGIMTEVEDGGVGPIVVCLNTSLERRIGPSRLWVDLARQWARAGARILRVEISGIGDSGVQPGQVPFEVFPPEAFDDISEIINAVSAAETDVVLVGLCSGAYHALEAGLVFPVRGVCAVNPMFTFTPPEMSWGEFDPRRQTIGEMKPWVKRLPAWWRAQQTLARLPEVAWWPVNRFFLLYPPAGTLRRLVDRDVEVLVIAGYWETQKIKRGAGRALRRLVRSGRLRFDSIDELDHSLFESTGRERVRSMLYEYVVDHFVSQNGRLGEVPSSEQSPSTVDVRDATLELRQQSDSSPSPR